MVEGAWASSAGERAAQTAGGETRRLQSRGASLLVPCRAHAACDQQRGGPHAERRLLRARRGVTQGRVAARRREQPQQRGADAQAGHGLEANLNVEVALGAGEHHAQLREVQLEMLLLRLAARE